MGRLINVRSLAAGMQARSRESYGDLSHLVLTRGRQLEGESAKGARNDDRTRGSVPTR
jgi:hypothetical protein